MEYKVKALYREMKLKNNEWRIKAKKKETKWRHDLFTPYWAVFPEYEYYVESDFIKLGPYNYRAEAEATKNWLMAKRRNKEMKIDIDNQMTREEAEAKVAKACGVPNLGAGNIVTALEALGLVKFKEEIKIGPSPRPVSRDDLKRDLKIAIADIKSGISQLENCLEEI